MNTTTSIRYLRLHSTAAASCIGISLSGLAQAASKFCVRSNGFSRSVSNFSLFLSLFSFFWGNDYSARLRLLVFVPETKKNRHLALNWRAIFSELAPPPQSSSSSAPPPSSSSSFAHQTHNYWPRFSSFFSTPLVSGFKSRYFSARGPSNNH